MREKTKATSNGEIGDKQNNHISRERTVK